MAVLDEQNVSITIVNKKDNAGTKNAPAAPFSQIKHWAGLPLVVLTCCPSDGTAAQQQQAQVGIVAAGMCTARGMIGACQPLWGGAGVWVRRRDKRARKSEVAGGKKNQVDGIRCQVRH